MIANASVATNVKTIPSSVDTKKQAIEIMSSDIANIKCVLCTTKFFGTKIGM